VREVGHAVAGWRVLVTRAVPKGRADHRDAMRAWRAQHARERAGVTDQGFERRGAESKVAIAEVSDAIEVEKVQRRAAPACIVCGWRTRMVRWHPSRAKRRRQ